MLDIKTFPAAKTGSPVWFNSSEQKGRCVGGLSISDIEQAIEHHERVRLAEYWETKLIALSGQGTWVEGLNNTRDGKGYPVPSYLKGPALKAMLGGNAEGAEVTKALRSLPLDEQKALFLKHTPTKRADLHDIVRDPRLVFAPDFRAMLSEAGSVEAFVDGLVTAIRNNDAPLYHVPRYIELLVILRSRALFLFPLDMATWTTKAKWATLRNTLYSGSAGALLCHATDSIKQIHDTHFHGLLYNFFASCSLQSAADWSLDLIATYEEILSARVDAEGLTGNRLHTARSQVARVGQSLRLLFNAAHPALAVTEVRTKRKPSTASPSRTDGRFTWLIAQKPELQPWSDAMCRFISQLTTARVANQVAGLNFFADYLLTLPNPPLTPVEVERVKHIYDATRTSETTYFEYLRTAVADKSRASNIINVLRTFFDWYADYLIASKASGAHLFRNPVSSTDSFGSSRQYTGQTSRNALPSYVLDEMKSLLIENDFAFSKAIQSHWCNVVDSTTGKPARVWFPGTTVCLYLMLEAPLRSHQARWVDSGLLDNSYYCKNANKSVANSSPHAIQGRRESVLRLQHDALRQADWFGLWINTNKTAMYDSADVGYMIPYVSDKLAAMLLDVREWQQRYLPPIVEPVAYYADKHSMEERKRVEGKGPQVAPLFRDPAGHAKNVPISYNRLSTFYTAALAEVQARIKRKHGHDIQLVTRNEDGELKWNVDLHSLRVSGITAMIESGVPLEVVSQFVAGHATLVMTLHYLKYSPLKIRAMLNEAHEKSLENIDFVGSDVFMENLDTFAPFMIGQDNHTASAGVQALRQKTGILTITSDGICPGTSCSTGGPVDSTKIQHGPVPGGQRCGLCRYWITGPAHLLGQVATVNNLAYTIRKKGLEVAGLNDERIDAEDAGNQRKARECRDRVDVLNRELAIDVEEWASRYRYAERSVALLDEFLAARSKSTGTTLPVPLLTAGSPSDLKVTLEEAHEFALLDHITQMSEFVPGFKNREAELEKNALLSKMMAANGLRPFLLTLNEKQAHEAGNMLSALLLQQVRSQELDDVLSGKKPLAEYPQLSNALLRLEEEAKTGKLNADRGTIVSLPINKESNSANTTGVLFG